MCHAWVISGRASTKGTPSTSRDQNHFNLSATTPALDCATSLDLSLAKRLEISAKLRRDKTRPSVSLRIVVLTFQRGVSSSNFSLWGRFYKLFLSSSNIGALDFLICSWESRWTIWGRGNALPQWCKVVQTIAVELWRALCRVRFCLSLAPFSCASFKLVIL